MRKRRANVCGMRDGTAHDVEKNGFDERNNSGWIVNHAGGRICLGKMATKASKKEAGDFPTPSTTAADNDDGE